MRQNRRRTLGMATALCALSTTLALADTRTFDLAGFDGVTATDGVQLFVTLGGAFEITATSDSARQLERLELDVTGTTITAGMENRSLSLFAINGRRVNVWITLPSLVRANASSGSELEVDAMRGPILGLEASSGAMLRIAEIDGEMIFVEASSGAEIEVADGNCGTLSADVSSGAFVIMETLECGQVNVSASSGATAAVNAGNSIFADANSGALVRVYGAPETTEVDTSSGGNIAFQ